MFCELDGQMGKIIFGKYGIKIQSILLDLAIYNDIALFSISTVQIASV